MIEIVVWSTYGDYLEGSGLTIQAEIVFFLEQLALFSVTCESII